MLGIDVSKATLACAFVDPHTRQLQWEVTVPNTAAGVQVLLGRTPAASPWVLEPTGPYSRPVAQQAQGAGRRVLLAQPRKAKAFLASIQSRAKTDRLDSQGLARYGLSVPLPDYPVKRAEVEELDQLLAARRGLVQSLARLKQQRAVLPSAAGPLSAAVAALDAQRKALERQIAHRAAETLAVPAVAELDQVPGIGPVTAAAVAACLRAKQFDRADQFVAYIGLDTRVRDSGRHKGQRKLTKQGDAELRRLLYLCARANLRSQDPDNPFRLQYRRELAKGLPTTAALCAVARKLARLCWSLARHGTRYDPTRVHHQPRPLQDTTPTELTS